MQNLVQYEDYTRENVHDIFDPDSPFTRSSGTWGISGIIRVPERPGDFVLFVTFGQVRLRKTVPRARALVYRFGTCNPGIAW